MVPRSKGLPEWWIVCYTCFSRQTGSLQQNSRKRNLTANMFDMKNCTWNLKHQNHLTCSVSIGFFTPYQFYHFTQEKPGHKHTLQLEIWHWILHCSGAKCSCPTISEMHTCIVILWPGHAQAITWKELKSWQFICLELPKGSLDANYRQMRNNIHLKRATYQWL